MPVPEPGRRAVVAAAGLGSLGGLAALAACSSQAGAVPDAAGAAPAGGGQAAAAPGGGAVLAELSAVPVGSAVAATDASGAPVVVAQPKAGKVVAFSAVCTHRGCTVAPAGAKLECPCHGSVFNALTGAVINGPAQAPLAPVAVKVSGGKVIAG